jgi:hypothetical protein
VIDTEKKLSTFPGYILASSGSPDLGAYSAATTDRVPYVANVSPKDTM